MYQACIKYTIKSLSNFNDDHDKHIYTNETTVMILNLQSLLETLNESVNYIYTLKHNNNMVVRGHIVD
jgi:ribosomal protein S2